MISTGLSRGLGLGPWGSGSACRAIPCKQHPRAWRMEEQVFPELGMLQESPAEGSEQPGAAASPGLRMAEFTCSGKSAGMSGSRGVAKVAQLPCRDSPSIPALLPRMGTEELLEGHRGQHLGRSRHRRG